MNARMIVSAIVGLFAVVVVYFLAPNKDYIAQGLLLPGKVVYSAISPGQVQVITHSQMPYQKVGHINIQMQYQQSTEKHDVDKILNKARVLAANIGANAILVDRTSLWHPPMSMLPFNQVHWIFSAAAVKVEQSIVPLAPGIVMPSR